MRKIALKFGIVLAAVMLFCAIQSSLSYVKSYIDATPNDYEIQEVKTQNTGYARASAIQDDNLTADASAFPRLKDLFKKKSKAQTPGAQLEEVYLGGMPVGMTMHAKGVIVLGVGSVLTKDGPVKPFADSIIKEGDVIIKINDTEILSIEDIHNSINRPESLGQEVQIGFTRREKELKIKATPALDTATKSYKLGLWIRDNAAGVGTVTYIKKDMRFGALGHPICDTDVGGILPIRGGNVYKCNIVGVIKGEKGRAGELRGLFLKSKAKIGTIDTNNRFGVFGNLTEISPNKLYPTPIKCATRDMVKPGAATIVSTVGDEICEYSIEIVKTNFQSSQNEKSMVIKVTDERLLDQTGGIVQGMSGSPILQDGKLCGAVTHVFINDPTKGFGVYLDWMLGN